MENNMAAATMAEIMIVTFLSNSLWDNYKVDRRGSLNILYKSVLRELATRYKSFIQFESINNMVRCVLCEREIYDPTDCIIYNGYRFDRVTCLNIFKKLSFIYGEIFIDINKS